jgi:hypothetical protein
MTNNKWDITINKVEGRPSKFGTGGAHICLPAACLNDTKLCNGKFERIWDDE